MDFTIPKYKELLQALSAGGYSFSTVRDFRSSGPGKVVMLRQDVDARPENSVAFARIQAEAGVVSTFYFRRFTPGFEEREIREVAALGHEVGYHYETMDTCRGNVEKAFDEFRKNLEELRRLAPVSTVCMHGSPLSKFDNRAIWERYNYRDLGITAEPYFDFDFNRIFYVTDTGRRWDGDKVSVRDKPREALTKKWPLYASTDAIIHSLREGSFPEMAMITMHPQRWNDGIFEWGKELVMQNLKNAVKRVIFVKR